MRLLLPLWLALVVSGCKNPQPVVNPSAGAPPKPKVEVRLETVTFKASDGNTVFADHYTTSGSTRIVLMFHQARSNAAEYATIAPELAQQGFDCLAVDLRCGGPMWSAKNRTGNASGPYLAAYPDMAAALKWAQKEYDAIAVIGSSYSASLALKLGAENPSIKAVAAFSPGEYFPNQRQVKDWNFACTVPVLMAFTQEEQLNGGLTLYQAGRGNPERARGDMILSFADSAHGATTLREEKNPKGAKKYMQGLIAFLKRHVR